MPAPRASFVPFTGPAAKKFGVDAVNVAYQHAIEAAFAGVADPTLLMIDTPRIADFAAVNQFYSDQALDDGILPLQTAVEAGTATELQKDQLQGIVIYRVEAQIGKGFKLRAPFVRKFVYGGPRASVDSTKSGKPLLKLNFPVSVQYLGTVDGKPVYFQAKQERTVFLIETGDPNRPWKINTYRSGTSGTGPLPDKG